MIIPINAIRFQFLGDYIEGVERFDVSTQVVFFLKLDQIQIYLANLFVTIPGRLNTAILHIHKDLFLRLNQFYKEVKNLEAKRLKERTEFDIEIIKELGYCSGIENYFCYIDYRLLDMYPFYLLDYLPEDYIMVINESHVTIPQVRAMYGGDCSRKENLV